MAKSKPRWGKTNVGWDIKQIVWQRWALGDTVTQTVEFFELHQGEYKNAPLDRATIKRVREELLDIPVELARKLIDELPEVKSLIMEQRPDLSRRLGQPWDSNEIRIKGQVAEGAVESKVNQKQEGLGAEQVNPARLHDKEIFEESDKILNESDFENFFEFLSRSSFLDSQLTGVLQFLEYFDSESNKYADSHLNYVYLKLCQNLRELSELIQIDSVERTHIQGIYDKYREKSVDNEWSRLLKKLLENTPDSDNLEMDELYLIIDGYSHNIIYVPEFSDIFDYEHYVEWQRTFDKLITNTRIAYKECRAAVRETLFI